MKHDHIRNMVCRIMGQNIETITFTPPRWSSFDDMFDMQGKQDLLRAQLKDDF
jgi:hypothetical protein